MWALEKVWNLRKDKMPLLPLIKANFVCSGHGHA